MTLRDMYGLQSALRNVGRLEGAKFAYAIAKNQSKVDAIIKAAEKKYRAQHEDEPKFQEARVKICEDYCTKDENGQPVLKNGMFEGLRGNKEFEAAIEDLKKEYKHLEEFKEKQQEKFEEVLDEELEDQPEFFKIRFHTIPENINADQLGGLLPLILDPPE